MSDVAFHWIEHHGYVGIFSLLAFGIVGLPVPDEWLLTFSGFLVFKGTLRFVPTFGAAFLGSACGITVSYTLGRIFDTYVIVKYGSRVRCRCFQTGASQVHAVRLQRSLLLGGGIHLSRLFSWGKLESRLGRISPDQVAHHQRGNHRGRGLLCF